MPSNDISKRTETKTKSGDPNLYFHRDHNHTTSEDVMIGLEES